MLKKPVQWEGQTDAQYAVTIASWRRNLTQRQGLATALKVFLCCKNKACRRKQACAGDPEICLWTFREEMPPEMWAELVGEIRARCKELGIGGRNG